MTCTSAFESDTASNFRENPRERAKMMTSGSNQEINRIKACKRGDSFVRDGFEITIEEIYHVNGRKKKKVKKRRLANWAADTEKKLDETLRSGNVRLTPMDNLNIEKELNAI